MDRQTDGQSNVEQSDLMWPFALLAQQNSEQFINRQTYAHRQMPDKVIPATKSAISAGEVLDMFVQQGCLHNNKLKLKFDKI